MTNIEYEEPEIPAEFKLKYVINNGDEKLKRIIEFTLSKSVN